MISDKVAISLPTTLLQRVDSLRKKTGETRSGVVQRALYRVLQDLDQRDHVTAYVRGYQQHPEGRNEYALATVGLAVLAEEPWE